MNPHVEVETARAFGTLEGDNQSAPGYRANGPGAGTCLEVPMQERSRSHPVRYPIPWACEPRPYPPSGAALRLGLPASYEDMQALGLDPYTGEAA